MPEAGEGAASRSVLPGPVIAVVGPTGVGKTAVGEAVALDVDGEIVSADSMQVYRGMDVGTAKPPASERLVPHHCLDMVDPGVTYSAALYQVDARDAVDGILRRGKVPVVVGGTGLYVRAALDAMDFPPSEPATGIRAVLESDVETLGPAAMHARLAETDPASAALIHPHNVRRTVRALEMAAQGVSYAAQHAGFSDRRGVYDTTFVGLTMERTSLYARIDERVDGMLEAGLVDEVRRLLSAGYREALTAAQAIGYKEIVPVIEGSTDLASASEHIKRATRRYAKRQLTWFRADPRVRWLDVTGLSTAEAATAAMRLVESEQGD
jgi:tRNA dimethylallyltransferase